MFEIIGIVVVGFIVWIFLRGMFRGAVKGHMMRSVDYAETLGVPRDFSLKIITQNEIMKLAVKAMVQDVPTFKSNEVYIQQGMALSRIYNAYLNTKK